jgi:hypothetical protein
MQQGLAYTKFQLSLPLTPPALSPSSPNLTALYHSDPAYQNPSSWFGAKSSANQWQKSSCQQQYQCPNYPQEKLCSLLLLLHQPCPFFYPLTQLLTDPTSTISDRHLLLPLPLFSLYHGGLKYCPSKLPSIMTKNLNILQYIVRKSGNRVMAPLLADPRVLQFLLLAIQDPFHNSVASYTHNPSYTSFHFLHPCVENSRVCFLINKSVNSSS